MLSFIKREKSIIFLLIIYYIFIVCITPLSAQYDLKLFFLPWIQTMLDKGIENVYKNPLINYPPISLYVMYFFGLAVQAFKANLTTAIYYLKDVVFLFDLASFYVIIRIMQRFKIPLVMMLLFLCNIAIIYNTIFWGQIDAVYTFFGLLSAYFVLTKRPMWAVAALVCALASKPQALLFIPVIGLLLIPSFVKKPLLIIQALAVALGTLTLIFSPFILSGTLTDYAQIIKKTTDYYPKVSMFAFNFWLLLFDIEKISTLPDSGKLLGLTFRTWGLGMFAIWSLVVIYPIFSVIRSQIKHMRAVTHLEWQMVLLSLTLLTVVFFFFNTQMHERYVHAAVVFAAAFAVISKRYIVYAALSVAYIANLTDVHSALSINPSDFIVPRVAAYLFASVIIYGIFELYYLQIKNNQELKAQAHTDLTKHDL